MVKPRNGCKDNWNAFMCKGAHFTKFDIPVCPTTVKSLPKKILTWEEAKQVHKKLVRENNEYYSDAFICFYIDDYKFDGVRSSIWLFPWMALRILRHYRGIITPDFSLYQDFPFPLNIWNIYRMRAFGYWAGRQGLEVINNVRWGTNETYEYCYEGIEQNSVVAIGTVGGNPKKLKDRRRFEEGLNELIRRLHPHTIIVYGSSNYPCFEKLQHNGIKLVTYRSATALYYERRKNNEQR